MTQTERKEWVQTLQSISQVDLGIDTGKDISDEQLLAAYAQFQQEFTTSTNKLIQQYALFGSTWYLQQAFAGKDAEQQALYQDKNIDFSFADIAIDQQGSIRNSFSYQ
ncbi:MAG: hypothetical protein H6765_00165 [Candidatus Peribacteria bacterium]|nr:MAG: hypothetical protein H6765_00165 [Candidatus Peribacteria bacterium]